MSEIDWQRLTAEHDRHPERDADEWLAALASMDDDPEAWDAAVDADPLMLFHGLPEVETGPADIEAMKDAVASMRRTQASMRRADGLRDQVDGSADRARNWSIAALLALAVSVAGLTGITMDSADVPTWEQASQRPAPVPSEIAQLPLVEDVSPEMGPLMQIEDDGVSLVVVMAADSDLSSDLLPTGNPSPDGLSPSSLSPSSGDA